MSRLHGYALAIGGVLLSFSYFAQEALGDRVVGPLFTAAVLAHVAGVLAVALGLPAWQAIQARRTPLLGTTGMLMVFFGLPILELTGVTIAATSAELPEVEDAAMDSMLFWIVVGAMLLANAGLLVLGVATLKAGVLPRVAAVLVVAGPLLTYFSPVGFPYDEAVTLSLGFMGMSWIGLAVARRGTTVVFPPENHPSLVQ
ncbi:MAG TPA: hypothetical protein VFK52_00555 [Nocardioidaceae bacterium]|nr:hypothetical protein [Nocardioidaceae bacterium]